MKFSLRTVVAERALFGPDILVLGLNLITPVVDVVEFDVGIISPHQLAEAILAAPDTDPMRGVVLSGRGPVWLYGALVHHYHSTSFVACYDPWLGGGVVVESHNQTFVVGTVVVMSRDVVEHLDKSLRSCIIY
jgi:CRISPR-associated protein Csx3